MPKFNVLCAGLQHESHSFCPVPADLDSFRSTGGISQGNEVVQNFRGSRSEVGAVIDLAETLDWSLTLPLFAHFVPSGPVTQEAFEYFSNVILKAIDEAAPLDGVIMPLHGAMVVEHLADAEGELVRRVREAVGPDMPIAVTFDLHGNISLDMARYANIVSTYRTTPHIDQYETAWRAGELLQRAMSGEITPRVAYAQRPMFDALDMGRTISGYGPMVEINRMASKAMIEHPTILDVAIHAGFDWSDKYSTGPSILVTSDNDLERAEHIAEDLITYAWNTRAEKTVEMVSVEEAIAVALEPAEGTGPLLIGDFTDCPGAAAVGDNTVLLRAMIDAKLEGSALASIADAESVKTCIEAGEGATVELTLGGKLHPVYSATPLHVTARVVKISDGLAVRTGPYFTGTKVNYGPSCLIDIDGILVIVATFRIQIDDRSQFRIFGINTEEMNILACKAVNHFRADFEPISRRLIYVDAGGIASRNYKQFPYRNIRRPIWPLDSIQ